jgi:hypothetical protein
LGSKKEFSEETVSKAVNSSLMEVEIEVYDDHEVGVAFRAFISQYF